MKKYLVLRENNGWITDNLENTLNQGYSVVTANVIGDGLQYVLKKDATEKQNNISEKLYMKLVERYIKSTADVDGQLFCGCREEDCTDYMCYSKCRKCLERYLEEDF